MSKELIAKILIRNDTAANWTSANPVISKGEMAIESDTRKFKFGDGVTTWTALSYAGISLTDVPLASGTVDGLMAKSNYTKLYNIETAAQVNVIESVKVNGIALTITSKGVNVIVPTGTLASKDKVAQADFDTALTTAFNALITSTATDTKISTALGSYYNKTEVDAKVTSVFKWLGTKATVGDLPSSGNTTGNVWHVTADNGEYAWNGSAWELLGGTVDLSAYATKIYVDTAITNKTSVTGNAGTATKLATARTISTTGAATGSVSFDGLANVSIALTANTAIVQTTDVLILNGGTASTTYV